MATRLPDGDALFQRFFARWYEPEERVRRVYEGTRPDVEQSIPAGVHGSEASPLTTEGQFDVARQLHAMRLAATGDWPEMLDVTGEPSIGWIDAFDRYYHRERVSAVIAGSDPADYDNELVVLCCEFGVMLGHVLRSWCPRLDWLYDSPYWESALLDAAHGFRINVFHWAIRKFSATGIDEGYRAKLVHCQTLVRQGWS